jgi:hypothetical protein
MNVSITKVFAGRRRTALAFAVVSGAVVSGAVLPSSAAWAQGMGMGGGGMGGGMGGHSKDSSGSPQQKPADAVPDAIPGATARAPAAPASKGVGDLSPTDALFDAINRGDIAAARDALNRGADLNGVNVLGMTPMELSVDLSRNDISFLLLSMRGGDSGPSTPTGGQDSSLAWSSAPVANTGKASSGKTVARKTATAKPAAPRVVASDGGTPLPSAGFLGFGSGAASN